ncbi:hypothetical protein, partial [Paralcaligenes ginsengisoli]
GCGRGGLKLAHPAWAATPACVEGFWAIAGGFCMFVGRCDYGGSCGGFACCGSLMSGALYICCADVDLGGFS